MKAAECRQQLNESLKPQTGSEPVLGEIAATVCDSASQQHQPEMSGKCARVHLKRAGPESHIVTEGALILNAQSAGVQALQHRTHAFRCVQIGHSKHSESKLACCLQYVLEHLLSLVTEAACYFCNFMNKEVSEADLHTGAQA